MTTSNNPGVTVIKCLYVAFLLQMCQAKILIYTNPCCMLSNAISVDVISIKATLQMEEGTLSDCIIVDSLSGCVWDKH